MADEPVKDITKTWGDETLKAEIIPGPAKRLSERETEREELSRLEDQLVKRCITITNGALDFDHFDGELDYEGHEAYLKYLMEEEKMDERSAMRMLRCAKYAHMSAKDSPVAFKMATAALAGILKAKAAESAVTASLNIGTAYIAAELPKLGGKDVEE